MTVLNSIRICSIDGKEQTIEEDHVLKVVNVWNRKERVGLYIEGKWITVLASDLIRAIENSTNIED